MIESFVICLICFPFSGVAAETVAVFTLLLSTVREGCPSDLQITNLNLSLVTTDGQPSRHFSHSLFLSRSIFVFFPFMWNVFWAEIFHSIPHIDSFFIWNYKSYALLGSIIITTFIWTYWLLLARGFSTRLDKAHGGSSEAIYYDSTARGYRVTRSWVAEIWSVINVICPDGITR